VPLAEQLSNLPALTRLLPGTETAQRACDLSGACFPSPILPSFGGTTEIMKEIIGRNLGL
jgi:hypothetical protein